MTRFTEQHYTALAEELWLQQYAQTDTLLTQEMVMHEGSVAATVFASVSCFSLGLGLSRVTAILDCPSTTV